MKFKKDIKKTSLKKNNLILNKCCLGIESTAHTFGVSIIDNN